MKKNNLIFGPKLIQLNIEKIKKERNDLYLLAIKKYNELKEHAENEMEKYLNETKSNCLNQSTCSILSYNEKKDDESLIVEVENNINKDEFNEKNCQEFESILPNIQVSVHEIISRSYLNELSAVFPSYKSFKKGNTTVITTMQKSHIPLIAFGNEVEKEKNRLLENVRIISLFYFSLLVSLSLYYYISLL